MNNIDSIYVINLEERKDRWNKCIREFAKYNIEENKIIRFDAFKPELEKHNISDYSEFNKILSRRSNYIQGALGCKLSHMSILKKYINIPNKIILILEDDFKLCNDFLNKMDNNLLNLDKLQNWNMCYLGFSMNYKHNSTLINLNHENTKFKTNINLELQNNLDLINNIKILKKCHTTHAYLINTSFIPKLLNICNNEPKEIDVCYTIAQEKYNIYGIYPCLISQYSDHSNILNKQVNYEKLINMDK